MRRDDAAVTETGGDDMQLLQVWNVGQALSNFWTMIAEQEDQFLWDRAAVLPQTMLQKLQKKG